MLEKYHQNLSFQKLKKFNDLKFGMFIHYGMSTFDGKELSCNEPLETYSPVNLDVDQWIRVASESGMKYAVLTTKHVSGFALWPSKYGNYSVKNAKDTTDVVGEFVKACRKYNIKPCFYYCAWDNTNLFGMKPTRNWAEFSKGMTHTNRGYRKFMLNQISELLTEYGDIAMLWIDIPTVLPMDFRYKLYEEAKRIQPNIIFTFNHSVQNGTIIDTTTVWPTDVMTMERVIPNKDNGNSKIFYDNVKNILDKPYYIPGEFNDTIGREWFYIDEDQPRDRLELLGTILSASRRGVNVLLNCPPNQDGRIPNKWIKALKELKRNLDLLNFFKKGETNG